MNRESKLLILLSEMALEFGQLHIRQGQWIKNKFAGKATEETFDLDVKAEEIILAYLNKCEEHKVSKSRFLDECISTDMNLKHRFIYQELKKSADVTQDDARRVAAIVINELPIAGINELLSSAMKYSRGTINAKSMQSALTRELNIEKEALNKTLEEMSKRGDARMDIKLTQLLNIIEKRIADIHCKLEV